VLPLRIRDGLVDRFAGSYRRGTRKDLPSRNHPPPRRPLTTCWASPFFPIEDGLPAATRAYPDWPCCILVTLQFGRVESQHAAVGDNDGRVLSLKTRSKSSPGLSILPAKRSAKRSGVSLRLLASFAKSPNVTSIMFYSGKSQPFFFFSWWEKSLFVFRQPEGRIPAADAHPGACRRAAFH
jgi:hypothetical protein